VRPLVVQVLPDLAAEIRRGLLEYGKDSLADQVDSLRVWGREDCGDDFCASFYTGPLPARRWSDEGEHKTVALVPRICMINLDVVDGTIRYVEVLDLPDTKEKEVVKTFPVLKKPSPSVTVPPRKEDRLPHRGWNSRYPRPNFVRWLPGPDNEYELYGGRLRILGVEVYDVLVRVGWRAAPMPDAASLFVHYSMPTMRRRGALEPAAAAGSHNLVVRLAHEIEHAGGWPTEKTKKELEDHLGLFLATAFGGIADDVGTVYLGRGGATYVGSDGITGTHDLHPAPPLDASKLTITWLDLTVDIPLS
jgi:hypothetical protein